MNPKILKHFIKKHFNNINADAFEFENLAHLDATDVLTFKGKIERNYCYWHEVEFSYLNKHYTGISWLNNQGFYFYTPAIMYQVLQNLEDRLNCVCLCWWFFKLKSDFVDNDKGLLNHFNQEQLFIISLFLQALKIDLSSADDYQIIINKIERLILSKS